MGGEHSNRPGPATYGDQTSHLTEALLIRNHDFRWSHDVEVEARADDGPVF